LVSAVSPEISVMMADLVRGFFNAVTLFVVIAFVAFAFFLVLFVAMDTSF
jgi:hypothetical protein